MVQREELEDVPMPPGKLLFCNQGKLLAFLTALSNEIWLIRTISVISCMILMLNTSLTRFESTDLTI